MGMELWRGAEIGEIMVQESALGGMEFQEFQGRRCEEIRHGGQHFCNNTEEFRHRLICNNSEKESNKSECRALESFWGPHRDVAAASLPRTYHNDLHRSKLRLGRTLAVKIGHAIRRSEVRVFRSIALGWSTRQDHAQQLHSVMTHLAA